MNNKKKKNMLPALAMAGPVSVWMIFVCDHSDAVYYLYQFYVQRCIR